MVGGGQGASGCSSSCKYRGFFRNLSLAGLSGRDAGALLSLDVGVIADDCFEISLVSVLSIIWQLLHGAPSEGRAGTHSARQRGYNSSERMTWKRVTL